MQRNQFWIFICIALIGGVMIEIMKAPAASPVRQVALKKFEAFLDEGSPVVVAENDAPIAQRITAHQQPPLTASVAQAEPVPQAMPAVVKPLASPIPADAKKKAAEDKKKAEEKKKKDEEEEKKKKDEQAAKEKEELEAQQQLEQQQQQQAHAETEKAAADAKAAAEALDTPGHPQQGAHSAQTTATNSAQNSETVAQWEAYITQNPSSTKTAQFAQYYKSGKISAATFYAVVANALGNSQATVRQQGVQALNLAPSARSFTALSDEANKETDTTTKAQAEQDLQSYSSVKNVSYLGPVITGSDASAALQAIDILKLSADTNLSHSINTTAQGGSATASAATLSSSYSPFVAELTQVEQNSSASASLRSMATETLQDLQSLLQSFQVSQN